MVKNNYQLFKFILLFTAFTSLNRAQARNPTAEEVKEWLFTTSDFTSGNSTDIEVGLLKTRYDGARNKGIFLVRDRLDEVSTDFVVKIIKNCDEFEKLENLNSTVFPKNDFESDSLRFAKNN